GGGDR
ncbi:hypothetical protein CFC21_106999, partial [Triticum aestivum]